MSEWVHLAHKSQEGSDDGPVSRCGEDLLTRTPWVDANLAYKEIRKGKATGNTCALLVRGYFQGYLSKLGSFIQKYFVECLIVGVILLSLSTVGLKKAVLETDVKKLWIEGGGRLQDEAAYSAKFAGTGGGVFSQAIIQTAQGKDVLNERSLLAHLHALLIATEIEVKLYGQTWGLEDICSKVRFPFMDNYMDQVLDQILPCAIVTPLDCFWEGSKVLGPHRTLPMLDVHPLRMKLDLHWTTLNPEEILAELQQSPHYDSAVASFKKLLREANIDTAYQQKPCLNSSDPACPMSAPNKFTNKTLDIGKYLANGCYGFSKRFMHWKEEVIVGGMTHERGESLIYAESYQSLIQTMGERELYERYRRSYVTQNMEEWTEQRAAKILATWQRKLTDKLIVFNERQDKEGEADRIYTFSEVSFNDLMKQFGHISYIRVAFGYTFMLVYACFSMVRFDSSVLSQAGLGLLGVLLLTLTVAAGLGFTAAIDIPFNAATTQVLPFLALGLGLDNVFFVFHHLSQLSSQREYQSCEIPELLKRTGPSLLLTSTASAGTFFLGALIPVPALSAFCLQAGILILFNLLSTLCILPAIIRVDIWRRGESRVDVLCCMERPVDLQNRAVPLLASPSDDAQSLKESGSQEQPDMEANPLQSSTTSSEWDSQHGLTGAKPSGCFDRYFISDTKCRFFFLTWFAENYYVPFIQRPPFQVFIVLACAILLGCGIFGVTKVEDGLDLFDLVPKGTNEYRFLEIQSKYFGFYDMHIVTKGDFDYSSRSGQVLLKQFYQEFLHISQVVRSDSGELPPFWLSTFSKWVTDMRDLFKSARQNNRYSTTGWHNNASEPEMLAWLMVIQTGNIDDRYNLNQALSSSTFEMIDDEGVINPGSFYNLLTAWYTTDPLAYDTSYANLHPFPKEFNSHVSEDRGNRYIPKSPRIQYAQIPFHLARLGSTADIIGLITKVRDICDEYKGKGLPTYPVGVPFTFWEQYLHLRFYLAIALSAALFVVFLIFCMTLMNPWAAAVATIVVTIIVVELFGFMGLLGMRLSAVPAVILIGATGMATPYVAHILIAFLTAVGSRSIRIQRAVKTSLAPVVHCALTTALSISMLVGAEFDFISHYILSCLLAFVFLSLLNGILLLPVLLRIIGPMSDISPPDVHADRILPPTPPDSPPYSPPESPEPTSAQHWPIHLPLTPQPKPKKPKKAQQPPGRSMSHLSLSTIPEESSQCSSSQEFVFEPEVKVETTSIPLVTSHAKNSEGRVKTTVRATTTVKVEVHTTSLSESGPDWSTPERNRRKRRKFYQMDERGDFSHIDSPV